LKNEGHVNETRTKLTTYSFGIYEINNIFPISNLLFTFGKYLLHFLNGCHCKHTGEMLMKWRRWWLWIRGLGAEKGNKEKRRCM